MREYEDGLLDLDFASRMVQEVLSEPDHEFSVTILEEAVNSLKLTECRHGSLEEIKTIDAKEKLRINHLGEATASLIKSVVSHSPIVEKFISDRTKENNDPLFPDKLRSFFFNEYKKLVLHGTLGDDLFMGVKNAVEQLISNPAAKCAALSIIVHLFIICDLFERTDEELERLKRNVAA